MPKLLITCYVYITSSYQSDSAFEKISFESCFIQIERGKVSVHLNFGREREKKDFIKRDGGSPFYEFVLTKFRSF